jgi:hypothetical protein
MPKPGCNRATPNTPAYMRALTRERSSVLQISGTVSAPNSAVDRCLRHKTGPKSAVLALNRLANRPRTASKLDLRLVLVAKIARNHAARRGKLCPRCCAAGAIAKELVLVHGIKVSRWTVRRDLHRLGFVPQGPRRVASITVDDQSQRLPTVEASCDPIAASPELPLRDPSQPTSHHRRD